MYSVYVHVHELCMKLFYLHKIMYGVHCTCICEMNIHYILNVHTVHLLLHLVAM